MGFFRPRRALITQILSVGLLLLATGAQAQKGPHRGPGNPPRGTFSRPQGKIQAPPNSPEPVKRLFTNAGKFKYGGVRWVEYRVDGERRRSTEVIIADGPQLRIETQSGSPDAGQIVVENQSERQQFFPGTNEIHILPSSRSDVFARLLGLFVQADRASHIKYSDGTLVAGRQTLQVIIEDPRGNVMQKLWLDRENGFVLKREINDRVGGSLGSFEFTKINYKPRVKPTDFQIQRKGARIITLSTRIRQIAKKFGLQPVMLGSKSGAKLVSVRPMEIDKDTALVQTYAYKDSRVTLFQSNSAVNPKRLERAANRLSYYTWSTGGTQFVLVGEVTRQELTNLSSFLTQADR